MTEGIASFARIVATRFADAIAVAELAGVAGRITAGLHGALVIICAVPAHRAVCVHVAVIHHGAMADRVAGVTPATEAVVWIVVCVVAGVVRMAAAGGAAGLALSVVVAEIASVQAGALLAFWKFEARNGFAGLGRKRTSEILVAVGILQAFDAGVFKGQNLVFQIAPWTVRVFGAFGVGGAFGKIAALGLIVAVVLFAFFDLAFQVV